MKATNSEANKYKTAVRSMLKKKPEKVVGELQKLWEKEPQLASWLKKMGAMAARFRLQARKKFGYELETFYRRFLERCLADRVLSTEEKKALHQLKLLFGLNDSVVNRIHDEASQSIYQRSVDHALSDGNLDPEEATFLRTVQQDLKLPEDVAQRIFRNRASEIVERTLVRALSDQRLSPDEEEELDLLVHSMGAQLEIDENTREILDRYRLYWLIDNGEIPAIEAPVSMKNGEKCYFSADASWCEWKTSTRSVRYGATEPDDNGGLPDEHIQREVFHEMIPIDSGRLYLTNQRLIFSGDKRSRSIPMDRINDFLPMQNGIYIHRKSGRNPFLQFALGVDVFSHMLARTLRDMHIP